MRETRTLLTVAGTDPSGGAGLQVDLQVFRDFGFHGTSVATAVVSQNTCGVRSFRAVEPECAESQLAAILDDIRVAGVKIGMLGAPGVARAIAAPLERHLDGAPVVLDPVLAGGTDGESLSESGLVETIREDLLAGVSLVTPNVPEAERLLGRSTSLDSKPEMEAAAERLVELGAEGVLLTAGHFEGGSSAGAIRDLLAVEGESARWLRALPRIDADVRGTGCQLSSAAVALLARGDPPAEAAEGARRYLNRLLGSRAREIGSGRPVIVRAEHRANPGDDS